MSSTGAGSARSLTAATAALDSVPARQLPRALARLHRSLQPGDAVRFRRSRAWRERVALVDLAAGAGFRVDALRGAGAHGIEVSATRQRTLADVVGPGMRLLFVGLNPSLYSADLGIPFARPGNRFWPATRTAGVLTCDRDPEAALDRDGVGFTDLVKRASTSADELTRAEYVAGVARVRALVEWLAPGAVCFVGLTGFRAALSPRATVGWQSEGFGDRPTYLMPSTSGRNAHARVEDLSAHLRAVLRGIAPAPAPCAVAAGGGRAR